MNDARIALRKSIRDANNENRSMKRGKIQQELLQLRKEYKEQEVIVNKLELTLAELHFNSTEPPKQNQTQTRGTNEINFNNRLEYNKPEPTLLLTKHDNIGKKFYCC